MLKVIDLWRSFGRQVVLSGINFQVDPGEKVLIVGPNGAGKSTLLACIAGILRPDQGEVKYASTLGYMGHSLFLYEELTLAQNLELFAVVNGKQEQDSSTLIDDFGIRPFANRLLSECSEGIRHRTALARAWLCADGGLLLDEPFLKLDPKGRDFVSQALRDFEGLTVFTSNEPDVIENHVGKTLLLHRGRIQNQYDTGKSALLGLRSVG